MDLDKFLDDVRNGIYPLIAFSSITHAPPRMNTSTSLASMAGSEMRAPRPGYDSRPSSSVASNMPTSSSTAQSAKSSQIFDKSRTETSGSGPGPAPTERPFQESRLILKMEASITGSSLKVLLQLDDSMNRQLTTDIMASDTSDTLVTELIHYGFISEVPFFFLIGKLFVSEGFDQNERVVEAHVGETPRRVEAADGKRPHSQI